MNPNMIAQLQALMQGGQGGQMPGRPGPGQPVPDPRIQAMQQMMQHPGDANNDEAMVRDAPDHADSGENERFAAGQNQPSQEPSTEEEIAMVQGNIDKQSKVDAPLLKFTGDVDQDRELLMHDPTDDNIDAFINEYGPDELPEELDPNNEENAQDEEETTYMGKQQTKQRRMNRLGRGNA